MAEAGDNLSVGQRQLFCLARCACKTRNHCHANHLRLGQHGKILQLCFFRIPLSDSTFGTCEAGSCPTFDAC